MKYTYQKSLGHISRTISKKLGKRLIQNLHQHNIDLTAEQWSVISILQHKKESTQKNIATEFGYDKVMVLRIIRKLEENNLVEKRTSSKDKRTQIIKLTPQGEAIYEKVEPIAETTIKNATYTLTDKEIELYLHISEQIIENLNKKSGV